MDGHSDIDLNDIIENQKGQIDDLTLKLEIMTKVVDSLSYSISHDLKAPLRAINGFSRLIFEEYESKLDLEGKHFLNSILRNAKYMGLQIDDLLRYSRASSDPLYMENIDTIQLINEIIAIYKKENEDRNISIEIEALPDIFGDKAMFYNVFNNILSNAFKFTRDKELTEIKIGCICGSDKNIYYFQDNGIGFNMKYSGKLFGIFQGLHTEEEFEGLGSGLAIVQRIIQRHGGETSIEAEINKGATFKIHLPINQA